MVIALGLACPLLARMSLRTCPPSLRQGLLAIVHVGHLVECPSGTGTVNRRISRSLAGRRVGRRPGVLLIRTRAATTS